MNFPERFNMADYFLYHNLEEGRENKVCLYFEDQTFTYAEAARMSNRVGNALRMLGVKIEDRVLIVLPDCPEFVWTWFGAARIGAVITMVNPLLTADDYRYYLEYTRARAAIVHGSFLKPFRLSPWLAGRQTRTATTSRSGCSLPARPAIQKARCIYSTTFPITPKSLPNARWASTKTT